MVCPEFYGRVSATYGKVEPAEDERKQAMESFMTKSGEVIKNCIIP